MDVRTGGPEVLINGGAPSTLTVMIRKFIAGVSLILVSVSFSFAAPASKPNLVLITLSSTRADRMGFLGANGTLTPNLDRLAGESIVFEHAYAQAPGSVVSHATILSEGYRTAAFVGSIDLDPWNGLAQGFDRGFQTYDAGNRPPIVGTGASPVQAK